MLWLIVCVCLVRSICCKSRFNSVCTRVCFLVRILVCTGSQYRAVIRGLTEFLPAFPRMLNTSSLLCDCQLQWLGQWLIDNGFQHSVTAVCAHPAGLAGRSILSVSPEEFVCGEWMALPNLLTQSTLKSTLREGTTVNTHLVTLHY